VIVKLIRLKFIIIERKTRPTATTSGLQYLDRQISSLKNVQTNLDTNVTNNSANDPKKVKEMYWPKVSVKK
jgi:hypothetical protein